MVDTPTVRFLDRTTPPHIFTLTLIAGVSALSMNVFLPSLPGLTAYFETDYATMQLSISLYLAVSAAMQIIVGPLSDRFGRRPVLLFGMAVFVLASVACIYATNVLVFLFFRMLQTAVIVGMVLSRAIVRDMVPQDQAASMIGYVTMGMAVVPMIGPLLGGFLDEAFGWTANFWLLALAGLAVFAICWSDQGETAKSKSSSIIAQIKEYPELVASPRFWGYSLAASFGAGAFFAFLGGAPFVGTIVYGLTPSELGIYFSAPTVGYFLGNFFSGRYSERFGINRMILVGAIVCMAGLGVSLIFFIAGFGSVNLFFGLMTFVGLGNGLVMPNANAGVLSVRPHLAGSASGFSGILIIGGGAALSAIAAGLLTIETGALPLIWIMFLTACASFLSVLFVIWRERAITAL